MDQLVKQNTNLLQRWQDRGQWVSLFGRRVFYIDTGGTKPVMVLLHGFPTSSYDFKIAIKYLANHFRVIAHDHLGFGNSDKPKQYSYSLIEQTDIALQLWEHLNLSDVTVVAHDYGTSIATELLARSNMNQLKFTIKNFVLSNGSIHIELSQLRLIQKLLRLSIIGKLVAKLTTYSRFKSNMLNLFENKNKLSEEELQVHWTLLNQYDGKEVIHKISRYTYERKKFWYRWIGALIDTNIPVDMVWARNDKVAVAKIAEMLHDEIANSSLKWIENCGHFPMIEKPEEWAENIIHISQIRREISSKK